MKNRKKLSWRVASGVMSLSLVATVLGAIPVFGAELQDFNNVNDECTRIIVDHFESINSDDWLSWANDYTPSVRDSYINFVTNEECQENNVGILTVNSVDILSVNRVPDEYAPQYPELSDFYATGNYECFIVTMNITTDEETEYFQDGTTNRLVVMVEENGEWGIGASCEYQIPTARGIGYGFISGDINNPPSTIKVGMHTGSDYSYINVTGTPTNVGFKTFVRKTVLGEIGTMGYNPQAVKAITLSDKMFSWWCALGHYRDTYGCDIIGNFDVAYSPSTDIFSSIYGNTLSSINSVIDMYVVASNGQFFAIGANNFSEYDNARSGVVVQSGANYLANGRGMNYSQILHYYLDNSSYNNSNVGTVIIGTSN